MIDAFYQIYKEEGFLSLYSGISPALLRQCTYGSIKFGTYYSLKKACNDYLQMTEDMIVVNFTCAICSGIISASIANPTDVLKVRLQALGREKVGTYVQYNVFKCFRHIYVHEGLGGLWKGVGPTSQRAGIIASVELPVYDYCKHKLMVIFGNHISNHFISSLIASFFSAIASNPIDVIRTRLMNQNQSNYNEIGNNHIYKGSIDCFLKTVKYEGVFSLYKGFVPTFVRMGPWNIIFFIIYEKLKSI
ncbi:Hypothetical protein CINCED_3A003237 [Cinara cedri]|nr:Hypothetical protein CINCED_3A003237 [Cinara cedri]